MFVQWFTGSLGTVINKKKIASKVPPTVLIANYNLGTLCNMHSNDPLNITTVSLLSEPFALGTKFQPYGYYSISSLNMKDTHVSFCVFFSMKCSKFWKLYLRKTRHFFLGGSSLTRKKEKETWTENIGTDLSDIVRILLEDWN